jgi:hypothetical protein
MFLGAASSGFAARALGMFKILEIVKEDFVESSGRYLPLLFQKRSEAIAHVDMLQAQFLRRGHDLDHDFWWASDDSTGEFYRWTIDGAPAGLSRSG